MAHTSLRCDASNSAPPFEWSMHSTPCVHLPMRVGTWPTFLVFDLTSKKDFKVHLSQFQFQKLAVLATAVAAIAFAGSSALAQDKVQSRAQDQMRDRDRLQDPVYGSQLMTDAERNEYRLHMRSLKTNQEREAYRLEHHNRMQERAREKGITLPEVPPVMGKGQGTGAGPGPSAAGGGMGGGSAGKK